MVHFLTVEQLQKLFPGASGEEITAINDSITNTIYQYCNTTFEPVQYDSEVLDSKVRLIPEHRPIVSVISLNDNSTDLVEDTDFYVYPQEIVIDNASGRRKGMTISYTAGYESIPEMVKTVAYDLAAYRSFKEEEGSLLFYKSQTFEEREYETDSNFNERSILKQLKPWVQRKKGRRSIRMGVI